MESTGERIKKARIAAGFTQEELASKIGVKFSAIHKYENGLIVNLKRTTIANLARALNVSPLWLMGYDDEESTETEKKPTAKIHSELSESDRVILDLIQSIPSGKKMEAIRYLRYLAESEDSE